MRRYIFVVGGVMSGIGKGVTTASLAKILKDCGYLVSAVKIDPYVNVDAGTMNPMEHGEVFVTEDGLECDQDIGNYERFLDQDMSRENYMTTGQVYQSVIEKERNLAFGGRCVEVVPHIPEEVISRIEAAGEKNKADFVLVEIGGTVGEYQNLIFLEAGRMMRLKDPRRVIFVLVSYLPVPGIIGEMKTKPTQYAVRTLNSAGIQPDLIIARSEAALDNVRKTKIATFCNVREGDVISAPDVKSIYEVPVNFEKEKVAQRLFSKFGLNKKSGSLEKKWTLMVKKISNTSNARVKIGLVGKYFTIGKFTLADSYISVIEALRHAALHNSSGLELNWLDPLKYEESPAALRELKSYHGLVVPGGFGRRGIEGKIKAIGFARKNQIPFLGLCLGMQLSAVEALRSLAGLSRAHSTEIDKKTRHPVIDLMAEQRANLKNKNYGGSMRLGSYGCRLADSSLSRRFYGEDLVFERHRHRYEFNNFYREPLEKAGFRLAGVNPEKNLVEIIELKNHPFFIASQFHPEFKSRPLRPHPFFREFIKAALRFKRRRH